jgi:hypothetical protein
MYLDPVEEYAIYADWITPLIGQKITPKNLVQRLNRYLNKFHPVRVRLYECTATLDKNDFTIGAEYDPDLDQACKKQFIINIIINCGKRTPWEITGDIADRFVLELVETLVHEYQHQHQYRSRRYKMNKERYTSEHEDPKIKYDQEYLGDPDEIDAYAANIAARLFLVNHKLNQPIDDILDEAASLDLKTYYTAFGTTHPVIDTLLIKIKENIKYLKDVDDGKIRTKKSPRPNLRRGQRT